MRNGMVVALQTEMFLLNVKMVNGLGFWKPVRKMKLAVT